MKANHNQKTIEMISLKVVLNILKEQNESKSQQEFRNKGIESGCFKYPQRTK